ncbi:MAG: hypothetical protein GF411_17195 [Candidatus Lokiarchaeota archaeon]|nr:hypothetical protein [Candidatus Lokiarchaeota archaeon]
MAESSRSILMTADKDFGELVYRQGKAHHGIILVRLHGVPRENKVAILTTVLKEHEGKLVGAFTVVEPNQVRISRPSA